VHREPRTERVRHDSPAPFGKLRGEQLRDLVYTTAVLREWIAADMAPVREFTRIRDVEYVDLPTGHWPQLTRPADLAEIILDRS
jgi:pimeloyl-ACP methyl ester carboxylesterase